MKKILILTKGFYGGGTEVALNSMLKKMDYSKYEITVMCINKRGPLLDQVPSNVKIKEIGFKKEFYRFCVNGVKEKSSSFKIVWWKFLKKLIEYRFKLSKEKNGLYSYYLTKLEESFNEYDYVLDFHGYGYFLTVVATEKIVAKKRVMWVHDQNLDWLYKVEDYLSKYDKFFCVSKAVKIDFDICTKKYGLKSELFYNLVDKEKILTLAEEKENLFTNKQYNFVTVGRLEYQKGYEYVIEAAKNLKAINLNFKWYILGNGNDEKKLKNLVNHFDLEKQVIFLGFQKNVYPYIKQCDLYIQPSRHEGFGLAVQEARLLKKIVIASDIPCFHEQIEHMKTGILIKLDSKELANTIVSILHNKKLRQEILINVGNENFDFTSELRKIDNLN